MKVKIMCNHPVATMSPPKCWDGKEHDCGADLRDVRALGEWLSRKVGFTFSYSPGHSRFEGDKCIFFPKRYQSGIHCMWVVKSSGGVA